MIMAIIRPETEMKDTGIEWISNIPKEWHVVKGKYILRQLSRPVLESDSVVTCFRDGEVTLRSNRRESGFTNSLKETGYQGVEPGDLVVHGMDGFAGAIGISDSRGKMSPIINVLDSSECKKYLMYYLRGLAFVDVFLGLSTGIRERSCDLRWNKLANLEYIIPLLSEQQAIADYLDETCSKIDEIIAEAKASIDEYKELKQSVIDNATMTGIHDSEMKNTDYVWFPEMPKSWDLVLASLLFREDVRPVDANDVSLSLSQVDGLIPTDDMSERSLKSATHDNWKHVIPDDLVLNRFKGHLGVFFASKYTGMVSFHYGVYHAIRDDVYAKYYEYLFHSTTYKNIFALKSNGITVGLQNLSNGNFYSVKILHPTLDEQIEIVKYLDKRIAEIDSLIAEKESLIKDLESYKKSLIYEVVTGKRRVV